jgi:spermidine synthase
VLLLQDRPHRRVLLLGLGGGSVAHAVRGLDPQAELVGVEWDEAVQGLARRHFGIGDLGMEIVVDDALRYLRRERRRFDLIVEDLFIGNAKRVRKPAGLLEEGYPLMARRLRSGGLLSANTIEETADVTHAMRRLGGQVLSLHIRGHWNRILVSGDRLPTARGLRDRLRAHSATSALLPALGIRRS